MSNRQTIASRNSLRLLADQDDCQLFDGEELLVTVAWTSWRATSPIKSAEFILECLRPKVKYVRLSFVDKNGHCGGLYVAGADEVRLYALDGMDEDVVASVIIHECVHATGTKLRCNRPWISGSEDFILTHPGLPDEIFKQPMPQFSEGCIDQKREEFTASIGTALVAPALGIMPKGSAAWCKWFDCATLMQLDILRLAIADAQRAASFILHRA
jgi:hypothetical protein